MSREEKNMLAPKQEQTFNEFQNEPHYYPGEILRVHPDVPGAAMWALHKITLKIIKKVVYSLSEKVETFTN
jgi:hypothetical protein